MFAGQPGWTPETLSNQRLTPQTYNEIVDQLNYQLQRAISSYTVQRVNQYEALSSAKYNNLLSGIRDLVAKNASAKAEYDKHSLPASVKRGDPVSTEQFQAIRQIISAARNQKFSREFTNPGSGSFAVPADGYYKLTLAGAQGGSGGKGGHGGKGDKGGNDWGNFGTKGGSGAEGLSGSNGDNGNNGEIVTYEDNFSKGSILNFTIGTKGANGSNGSDGTQGQGPSGGLPSWVNSWQGKECFGGAGGSGGQGGAGGKAGGMSSITGIISISANGGKGGNGGSGGHGGGGGGGGKGESGKPGESGWTGSGGNPGNGYLKIEW